MPCVCAICGKEQEMENHSYPQGWILVILDWRCPCCGHVDEDSIELCSPECLTKWETHEKADWLGEGFTIRSIERQGGED